MVSSSVHFNGSFQNRVVASVWLLFPQSDFSKVLILAAFLNLDFASVVGSSFNRHTYCHQTSPPLVRSTVLAPWLGIFHSRLVREFSSSACIYILSGSFSHIHMLNDLRMYPPFASGVFAAFSTYVLARLPSARLLAAYGLGIGFRVTGLSWLSGATLWLPSGCVCSWICSVALLCFAYMAIPRLAWNSLVSFPSSSAARE